MSRISSAINLFIILMCPMFDLFVLPLVICGTYKMHVCVFYEDTAADEDTSSSDTHSYPGGGTGAKAIASTC